MRSWFETHTEAIFEKSQEEAHRDAIIGGIVLIIIIVATIVIRLHK